MLLLLVNCIIIWEIDLHNTIIAQIFKEIIVTATELQGENQPGINLEVEILSQKCFKILSRDFHT